MKNMFVFWISTHETLDICPVIHHTFGVCVFELAAQMFDLQHDVKGLLKILDVIKKKTAALLLNQFFTSTQFL